jgi:NAD(P)H-quinone oxidoreductase subunit N
VKPTNHIRYNWAQVILQKLITLTMALIAIGKGFIRDLEKTGALGVYMPLEGGFEGRYQRRLRANGYQLISLTARGLGDLDAYLFGIHGVRPPHLGKKNIGQEGAVGQRHFVAPIAGYQVENLAEKSKGLVLWIIEGHILSRTEINYLINLPASHPQVKVVLELGGSRFFRWENLADCL